MTSRIRITLLSILLIITAPFVKAQDDNKTVAITVSGSGKTQDEAKQTALRSAIEQAFGTFISSKTEIFNDEVVADQIASVASGNIQSFEVLNQSQLPDGSWGLTLKAQVSVSKLTSFVQAKGIAVEIQGGMFALNIKQQLLNEQGEINAICEMVGLLHEPMQTAFDYLIKAGDPKSLDSESQNWAIPIAVTATANKNMDFCADYCIKTLTAVSLKPEEAESYMALKKEIYPVNISYKGKTKSFYLRKQMSIQVLNNLVNNWGFYAKSFSVHSGIDEVSYSKKGKLHDFGKTIDYLKNGKLSMNFLTAKEQAGVYAWNDKKSLQQINQMSGYTVKPSGVHSQFKHGGYVVSEPGEYRLGLVVALINVNANDPKLLFDRSSRKRFIQNIELNGYKDWRLPAKWEMEDIYDKLVKTGIKDSSNHYLTVYDVIETSSNVYCLVRTIQQRPNKDANKEFLELVEERKKGTLQYTLPYTVEKKENVIGSQIWSTQNLDVSTFRNGDFIPNASSNIEWADASEKGKPAWCYYENNPEKGKLYNWYAINDPRGLAPMGWHIPNNDEWRTLYYHLGSTGVGSSLEEKYGWLQSGWRTEEDGFEFQITGSWFSSKEINARAVIFMPENTGTSPFFSISKGSGVRVRILKD